MSDAGGSLSSEFSSIGHHLDQELAPADDDDDDVGAVPVEDDNNTNTNNDDGHNGADATAAATPQPSSPSPSSPPAEEPTAAAAAAPPSSSPQPPSPPDAASPSPPPPQQPAATAAVSSRDASSSPAATPPVTSARPPAAAAEPDTPAVWRFHIVRVAGLGTAAALPPRLTATVRFEGGEGRAASVGGCSSLFLADVDVPTHSRGRRGRVSFAVSCAETGRVLAEGDVDLSSAEAEGVDNVQCDVARLVRRGEEEGGGAVAAAAASPYLVFRHHTEALSARRVRELNERNRVLIPLVHTPSFLNVRCHAVQMAMGGGEEEEEEEEDEKRQVEATLPAQGAGVPPVVVWNAAESAAAAPPAHHPSIPLSRQFNAVVLRVRSGAGAYLGVGYVTVGNIVSESSAPVAVKLDPPVPYSAASASLYPPLSYEECRALLDAADEEEAESDADDAAAGAPRPGIDCVGELRLSWAYSQQPGAAGTAPPAAAAAAATAPTPTPTVAAPLPREPTPPTPPAQVAPPPSPPPTSPPDASTAPGSSASVLHPLNVSSDGLTSSSGSSCGGGGDAAAGRSRDAEPKAAPSGPPLRSFSYHLTGVEGEGVPECFSVRTSRPGGGTLLAADRVQRRRTGATPLQLSGAWLAPEHSGAEAEPWMRIDLCVGSHVHSHTYVTQAFVSSQWEKTRGEPWWVAMRPSTCRLQLSVAPLPASVDGPLVVSIDRCSLCRAAPPPAQGADAAASCYVEVYARGRDGTVGAHPADFTGHVLTAASSAAGVAGGGQDEAAAAAAAAPASTVSPILWSTCTLRGAWGAVLRVMVDGTCVGWREVYAGPPDARVRELDLWPPPAAAAPAPSWIGSSVSARAWVDATTAAAPPLFRAPARAGGNLPRFLTLCVESVALRNLPGAEERGAVLQLIRRVSPAEDDPGNEVPGGGEDGVVAEVLYRSSDASTTPCPQWQLGVCCEMPNPAFARGGGGGGGGSGDGSKAVLAIEVLRDTAPRNTFLGCFELELGFDRWAAKMVEGCEGGTPSDAQLRTPTRFRELNARLTPRKLHDAHWNTSDLALLNKHGTLGTVTVTYSLSCAAFAPAPAAFDAAAPAPSQELPGSTLPTPAPAPVQEDGDNDDDDDEDTDEEGGGGAGDGADARCAFDLRLTVSAVCGFAGAQDRRVCVKARQVYSGNEANEVLEKTMATELAAPAVDHRGLRHYAFGDRSCFPLDTAHDARSHLREQAAAAAAASHPSERGWAVAAGAACGNGGGAAQQAGRGGRGSNIPFLKKRFARERRRRLRHPDDVSDRGGDDEAEGAAAVAEEAEEPLRPSQILASFEISACDADDVCMGRATLVVQKKGLTFGEAHEVFLELAEEEEVAAAAGGGEEERRPLGSAGVRVTWEVLRTPLSSLVIVPSFRPPPPPPTSAAAAAAAAAQLLSVPSPQTAAATANRKLATKFCVDDGGGCPPPPWVSAPPSLWNVDLDDRSRCCEAGDAPWGDEVCRVTAVHSSTGQRLDDAAAAAAATSDAAFPLRLYPRPMKAPTLYVSQWSGQHMLGAAQVCLSADAAHGSCEVSGGGGGGGGAEGLVHGSTQGSPGPGPGFGNVMAQCSFAPFQLSWKWLTQQKDVCEGPTHCARRGCFVGGVGGGGVHSPSAEDDEEETAMVAAAGGEDLVLASEPLPSLGSLLATCVVSLEPPPGVLGGGSSGPQAILDSLQMFVEVTDSFTEAVLLRRPLSRFSGVHLSSGGDDDDDDGSEPALNSASFRLFMSAGEAGADGRRGASGAGGEESSAGIDRDGSEEDGGAGVNADGCVAASLHDIQRVVRCGTAAEPRVSFVLRSRCRHPVLVVRADLWVEPDAAAAAAAAQTGGGAGVAAAAAAAAPRERRRCHVSVLEGKHLSALSANARAASALRVVGRVGPARNPRRFATRAFAEAACPLINERFDFPMRQASEPLRLEVWGVSEGRQTCLGTAEVHLSGRASAWVRVSPPAGRGGDAAATATQRPVGGLLLLDWRHVFETGLRPASVPDLAAEQQRRSVSVGCVLQPQATKSDPQVTGAAAVQLRKGRVLQAGGVTALGTCCNVLREYVAATKQWTAHGVGSGVPRHGHSAVLHSKCVYVFGGHGLNGYHPGSVTANATAGSTAGGDGAAAAAAQGSMGFLKSTMCYNTTLKEWSEVPTTGTAEDYRAGHTAVLCGHKMLVWGGWELVVRTVVLPGRRDICSTLERRRSDMVCLDLQDRRWRRVAQGGAVPRARAGHTAELHDGRLWVFGGTAEAGFAAAAAAASSNGGVGVSAASSAAATEYSLAGDDSEVEDLLDTTPSQAPSPSSASAAAAAAARRRQQQQRRPRRRRSGCVANGVEFLSCLHAFDLETKTWTQVAARGDVPRGREGHSSALATGDDATSTSAAAAAAALYVYGGRGACGALGSCYAFAFDASSPRPTSGFWRRVVFDGCPTPPPRSGHTMLLDASGVVPPARNHRRPPATFALRRLRLSGDDAPTGAAAAEPTCLGVAVEILPSPPQCLKASAAAFYGRGGGRKGRVWLTLKRHEGQVGWRVINRLDLFGAPPASRRAAAAIFDEARPCALLQEACSGDRLEVEATAGSGGGEDGAALVAQEVSVEVHYTHPDRRAATNPSIGAKLMVFGGSGGKGQAPCAHQYVVPCAGERMSQLTFVLQYRGDRTTVAEPTVRYGSTVTPPSPQLQHDTGSEKRGESEPTTCRRRIFRTPQNSQSSR